MRKKKRVARSAKEKLWSSAKADAVFSKYIRERDGKCLRCHQNKPEPLSCSHFWGRRCSALRYEPDNCIALHLWSCHIYGWEKEKQGEYRDFMLERLGKKRYEELKKIYYQGKKSRKEAIKDFMEFYVTIQI